MPDALLPCPSPAPDAPQPPDAERVRGRAFALAAVIQRAFLEQASLPAEQYDEYIATLRSWIAERSLGSAFEADEQEFIDTPQGQLDPKETSDATWLSEGLGVLAWALSVADLPAHDEQVDLFALHEVLGFLDDVPPTLEPPRLRAPAELARMHGQLVGIHWRLREFRLRPGPLDFSAFAARRLAFGRFDIDLDGVALAEGDLAVDDGPLQHAHTGSVQNAASIAFERHRAIEWLADARVAYARVDTPT
ncbi:MAG: DUF4272 domain-containing protein [Myxococcota bacterium]